MRLKKRLGLFVIIAIAICVFVLDSMRMKNAHVQEFMNELRNADVLVFGSSHAYINLNGSVLWDKYGIASVSLAQGEQPLCMTYFEMESALRWDKPQIVIVEPYMAVTGSEYNGGSDKYVNALLSFPIWSNIDCRIEATRELKDVNRLEYILGFPIYHSDYKLPQFNVIEERKNAGYESVGYDRREDAQLTDRCNSNGVIGTIKLDESTESYLYKIINICREEKVALVFVLTPYQASEEHIMKLNAVKQIAEEEGIEYVDMNNYIEEIGIDLDSEMADWGHALISGSEKNSMWLGKYLQENYRIADRREDVKYENWDAVKEAYEKARMEITGM